MEAVESVDIDAAKDILETFALKISDNESRSDLKQKIDHLLSVFNSDLFRYVQNIENGINNVAGRIKCSDKEMDGRDQLTGVDDDRCLPQYRILPSGRVIFDSSIGRNPEHEDMSNGIVLASKNKLLGDHEKSSPGVSKTEIYEKTTNGSSATIKNSSDDDAEEGEPGNIDWMIQHYSEMMNNKSYNRKILCLNWKLDQDYPTKKLFTCVTTPKNDKVGSYEHRVYAVLHSQLRYKLYAHDHILDVNGICVIDMSKEEFEKIFETMPMTIQMYVARETAHFDSEFSCTEAGDSNRENATGNEHMDSNSVTGLPKVANCSPKIPGYVTPDRISPEDQLYPPSPRSSSLPEHRSSTLYKNIPKELFFESIQSKVPPILIQESTDEENMSRMSTHRSVSPFDKETIPKLSKSTKLTVDDEFTSVTLLKSPSGFGMSIGNAKVISGGKNVKERIVVLDVKSGGPASLSGLIKPGDIIEQIDGIKLDGLSHRDVSQMMKDAKTKINLLISRRSDEKSPSIFSRQNSALQDYENEGLKESAVDGDQESFMENLKELVIVRDRNIDGFGFTVIGGFCPLTGQLPVFVKTVTIGGPAEKAGLQKNDQILSVNEVNIKGFQHEHVVAMMRQSGNRLRLAVSRSHITDDSKLADSQSSSGEENLPET